MFEKKEKIRTTNAPASITQTPFIKIIMKLRFRSDGRLQRSHVMK